MIKEQAFVGMTETKFNLMGGSVLNRAGWANLRLEFQICKNF